MIALLNKIQFFQEKHIENVALIDTQGYSNENYLVVADDKKYILRKLLRTDIDRDFEYKVQSLTYSQYLTAEPLFYDEKYGLMLFEFIEGRHKQKLEKIDITALVKTLKKLHGIKINKEPVFIKIKNQNQGIKEAFEIIDKYNTEYVLCHNDLNPQNVFFSDEVKLIDWEYAGINDRYFDLASVCVEFDLNKKDEVYFLESYFESGYEINHDKHNAYKVIYKALCAQWFEDLAK
jgi:thiamine kinase-like enzyme